MRTARLQSVIVFYDGPEIFIAKDEYGTSYLCVAVPTASGTRYASIPIKNKDIHDLASGEVLLHSLMKNNSRDGWCLSDPLNESFERFTLQWQNTSIPDEYVPDEDFSIADWLGDSSEISELV